MKVEKFENIETVFNKLIEKNKKHVIIRHELKPGKEIKEHFHEDVNEFVIVKNGSFRISCDDEVKKFNLNNKINVIYLPKGSKHSLKNFGDKLSYFVVRGVVE